MSLRNWILRSYISAPDHPAKYRFVRWLGQHAVPPSGLIATAYPGVRMNLSPSDWIEYLILRDGEYEPLTLDFIRGNLRPGDSAFCAGINNGLHEIVAARAVGSGGLVIGCDPQPTAILKVRGNMSLNGMPEPSLRLVQVALGSREEPGLQTMAWPPHDNHGAGGFGDVGAGLTVAVHTISEVAATFGIDRLRLLLLDVQGHEIQTFSGLGELRPELMVLEDGVRYDGVPERRAELYSCLKGLGYVLSDLRGTRFTDPGELPAERTLVAALPNVPVQFVTHP
jgi:FkbM family methyltransferase